VCQLRREERREAKGERGEKQEWRGERGNTRDVRGEESGEAPRLVIT
jgi:hypothetical protein